MDIYIRNRKILSRTRFVVIYYNKANNSFVLNHINLSCLILLHIDIFTQEYLLFSKSKSNLSTLLVKDYLHGRDFAEISGAIGVIFYFLLMGKSGLAVNVVGD